MEMEATLQEILYGNENDLQENKRASKLSSPCDRLCTKTRFETEVTDNSEKVKSMTLRSSSL